jgi:Tfp pilus assembly protein PilF
LPRDILATRIAKFISSGILLRMKLFLAVVLLMAGLVPAARAQQEADDKYIAIYGLIQQAETFAGAGEMRASLSAFTDAQARLQKFQKLFPNWNPTIVSYRLEDVAKKIAEINNLVSPEKAGAPIVAPAAGPDKLQPQVDALQSQLRSVQSENAALSAKLKEALATQPAMIDATELVKAQAQIRSLMKENELIKTGRGKVTEKIIVTDTNEISNLRAQLAASVQKLTDEHGRAQQLVAENAALQKNLTTLARAGQPDSTALDLLRSENDRLKNQLAALEAAGKNAAAAEELAAKLQEARQQIATLQSAAVVATLEKGALENKVRKLSDEVAALRAANFEGRIRDLTEQRAELVKQLEAAKKKASGRVDATAAAQLAALNDEVKALRSRVAVDESKPLPYTTDELALFSQPSPRINPEPIKKPIQQMPAGTADLVASAQRHFASREFDQAEADYLKILDRDQNNGLALANLATIELQEDKLADAEKHLMAAVAQSPDDAYNLSTLGYLKFRQEKYDDALDVLSRAAQIDPQNPEIQNYLGVTMSHKGLRQQAEAALRKAIQLRPDYAPAHNNLAVIYLNQNPPSPLLARWHYQKALDAGQPRNADLEKMLAAKGAPVPQ